MLSLNEESKMIAASLTGQRQPILSEGNVISTPVTAHDWPALATTSSIITATTTSNVVSPLHHNVSTSFDEDDAVISCARPISHAEETGIAQINRSSADYYDPQPISNEDEEEEELVFDSPIRTVPYVTSADHVLPIVSPDPSVNSSILLSPKYLGDIDETHNNSSLTLGCDLEQFHTKQPAAVTSVPPPAPIPANIPALELDEKKDSEPTRCNLRRKSNDSIPNYMKPTKSVEVSTVKETANSELTKTHLEDKQTKTSFLSRLDFLKSRKKTGGSVGKSKNSSKKQSSSNASASSSQNGDSRSVDESVNSKSVRWNTKNNQPATNRTDNQIEQWLQMPSTASDVDINDANEALKHRLLYPQTLGEFKDTVSPLVASNVSTPRLIRSIVSSSTPSVDGHRNMNINVHVAAASRIASARAHLKSETNGVRVERAGENSSSGHHRPRYMQPTSAVLQKCNPDTVDGAVYSLSAHQDVPIPNADSNVSSILPTSSFETLESVSTPKTSTADEQHSPKKQLLASEFYNFMKPTGSSNRSVTKTPRTSSSSSVSSSTSKVTYKSRASEGGKSRKKTFIAPLTQPVAPKFHELHYKSKAKSQEEIDLEIIEEFTVKHPFRATPILIHDLEEYFKKSSHVATTPKLTVPEPFHFASDDRAAKREHQMLERKLLSEALDDDRNPNTAASNVTKHEMELLEECKKQFRARPMPDFGSSPPIKYNEKFTMLRSKNVGEDSNVDKTPGNRITVHQQITIPVPFKFHTEERIEQRHAFEARIKEKMEKEQKAVEAMTLKNEVTPGLAFTPSMNDDRPFYIRAMERKQTLEYELQVAREKNELAEMQEFRQFKARRIPNSSKAHYINKYNYLAETPTKKSDERQRAITTGMRSNNNGIMKDGQASRRTTSDRSVHHASKTTPTATKKSIAALKIRATDTTGDSSNADRKKSTKNATHAVLESNVSDEHEDFLDSILGEVDHNNAENGSENVLIDEDYTTTVVTTTWSFDPFGSTTNDASFSSEQ